jgi:hypothetical protein
LANRRVAPCRCDSEGFIKSLAFGAFTHVCQNLRFEVLHANYIGMKSFFTMNNRILFTLLLINKLSLYAALSPNVD